VDDRVVGKHDAAVDTFTHWRIDNILYERKVKWHSPGRTARMAVTRLLRLLLQTSADTAAQQVETN
jgi:hypothetical protein